MPCYDHRTSPSYMSEQMEQQRAQLQKRNDELAEMLCGLCRFAPQAAINSVPGLALWWEEHRQFDANRPRGEGE